MRGSLCVWWWKRLRARVRAQRSGVRLLAAVATPLLCLPAAALANPDQQNSEQSDGQSRYEFPSALDYIRVYWASGERTEEYRTLVLIRPRIVELVRTEDLGVTFENLDRLDVSGIPLVGGLFDKPLSAGDFTEQNRVGAAYSTGNGGLAVVIGKDDVPGADEASISVVNGKGRFRLLHDPLPVEIQPTELGELGTLQSVRQLLSGDADRRTAAVLAGLTRSSVPEAGRGLPVLGDIPVLQTLFRGTAHRDDENNLMILIKPSVLVQEEEY